MVGAEYSTGPSLAPYQSVSTLPAAPSLTAIVVSTTQINLAWNTVAGASGYLIDICISGVWSQLANYPGDTIGAAISDLSPDTTYSFKVGAYNSSGTTWSSIEVATTL